jgi:2-dehydropantoate 2-reductase
LESKGVTINGETWFFPIVSPEEKTEPADLVIVIVKDTALLKAVEDVRNQVGENTVLVSFMNGITSEQVIAERYGEQKVIYGLTRKSVVMKDGVCSYDPQNGYFAFGEAHNETVSPRIQKMAELFTKAKIPFRIEPDMIRAIWLKFMCNVSENQTSALLGIPFGAWRDSQSANAVREMALREVIQIANKKGIGLGESDIVRQRAVLQTVPYFNKTSMLQDIESGRPTEVEMFAGTVRKLGKETGVATPVNEFLYFCLKTLEEKNSGKIKTEEPSSAI